MICLLFAVSGDAVAVGSGKELTWPGGGKGEVRFEGKEHAEKGHACEACHPGLFRMKYGTAPMTMASLDSGKFCGTCHNGTAAFGTNDPKKCHECHREGGKDKKHKDHEDKKHKHDD